jgi:hypothetical protein
MIDAVASSVTSQSLAINHADYTTSCVRRVKIAMLEDEQKTRLRI